MKSVNTYIILILLSNILFLSKTANAQSNPDDYYGTWRWLGGNRDTFLIVLKPSTISSKLTGYHSFAQNGQTLESSIPGSQTTTSDSVTINGEVEKDGKFYYIIHDLTRDAWYMGTMEILQKNPDRAIFYTRIVERKHLIFEGEKPRPRGRTFPDNILLERVN